MLTVAYGEATLDRSNVYRWYKMFSEGREDVNDEERAGRPSTSTTDENIDEVKKIVLANRRITVREVAEDLNIGRSLSNEGIKKVECVVQSISSTYVSYVTTMIIPKGTTGKIQLLDVYGFRIWKNFAKRFSDIILLLESNINLHERNNIIKLHSMIHNQLSSPRCHNLFKYSWFKYSWLYKRKTRRI
ncbi:SETMR methyltransferase, partial [Acromyrmex heyeri]